MRNYKEYGRWFIGESEIATLICTGIDEKEEDLETYLLEFGYDGEYFAYIVDEEVEIKPSYKLLHTFTYWCRFYDDYGKSYEETAKKINIYSVGDSDNFDIVIQIIH